MQSKILAESPLSTVQTSSLGEALGVYLRSPRNGRAIAQVLRVAQSLPSFSDALEMYDLILERDHSNNILAWKLFFVLQNTTVLVQKLQMVSLLLKYYTQNEDMLSVLIGHFKNVYVYDAAVPDDRAMVAFYGQCLRALPDSEKVQTNLRYLARTHLFSQAQAPDHDLAFAALAALLDGVRPEKRIDHYTLIMTIASRDFERDVDMRLRFYTLILDRDPSNVRVIQTVKSMYLFYVTGTEDRKKLLYFLAQYDQELDRYAQDIIFTGLRDVYADDFPGALALIRCLMSRGREQGWLVGHAMRFMQEVHAQHTDRISAVYDLLLGFSTGEGDEIRNEMRYRAHHSFKDLKARFLVYGAMLRRSFHDDYVHRTIWRYLYPSATFSERIQILCFYARAAFERLLIILHLRTADHYLQRFSRGGARTVVRGPRYK